MAMKLSSIFLDCVTFAPNSRKRVLPQKASDQLWFPKCLRPPHPLGRERPRDIPCISALFGRPPSQPPKEKSRIETISRADRVHRLYTNSGRGKCSSFRANDGTPGSALYRHPGNAASELIQRALQRRFVCHATGFPFVWQQQVDIVQQLGKHTAPSPAGVIIGVERDCEACAFQLTKERRKFRLQRAKQEERREVKVLCRLEIGNIDIPQAELRHGSGVGQDMPWNAVRKHQRDAGSGARSVHSHAAQVDPAPAKPLQGEFAEGILSYQRHEADVRPEYSEVMREDGRGASQREPEVSAEQFSLDRHDLGQSIHNQVEIDFACDGDIQGLHRKAIFSPVSNSQCRREDSLLSNATVCLRKKPFY